MFLEQMGCMMFCGNCGTEIRNDAAFCPKCGTKVQVDENIMPADVQVASVAPAEAPSAPEQLAPVAVQQNGRSNKRIVIIAVIAVVIVAVAAIVSVFAFSLAQKHERTHATIAVPISVSYTGNGANDPIGVPLVIEGTDLDGNHVEERFLSPANGGTVDLQAGSYTVTVPGPTPSKTGQVYKEQGKSSQTIEVPVPDEDGDKTPAPEDEPNIDIELKPVPPDQLTNDDIEGMKNWINDFNLDDPTAQEAEDNAINEYEKEKARVKLEEEKQAALNANPSSITGNGTWSLSQQTLTGTVKKNVFEGVHNYPAEEIIYLQLPSNLTVSNVEHHVSQGSVLVEDKIVLGDSFSSCIGQVVTISGELVNAFTRTARGSCSPLAFENAKVTKTFE